MTRIHIESLRQNLRATLAKVAEGEAFEIVNGKTGEVVGELRPRDPSGGPMEITTIDLPATDPCESTDWASVSVTPLRSHDDKWKPTETLRLFTKSEDLWYAWSAVVTADMEVDVTIGGTVLPESHARSSAQTGTVRDWQYVRVTPGWLTVTLCMKGEGGVGERALYVTRRNPTSLIRGMGRRPGELFDPVMPRRVSFAPPYTSAVDPGSGPDAYVDVEGREIIGQREVKP